MRALTLFLAIFPSTLSASNFNSLILSEQHRQKLKEFQSDSVFVETQTNACRGTLKKGIRQSGERVGLYSTGDGAQHSYTSQVCHSSTLDYEDETKISGDFFGTNIEIGFVDPKTERYYALDPIDCCEEKNNGDLVCVHKKQCATTEFEMHWSPKDGTVFLESKDGTKQFQFFKHVNFPVGTGLKFRVKVSDGSEVSRFKIISKQMAWVSDHLQNGATQVTEEVGQGNKCPSGFARCGEQCFPVCAVKFCMCYETGYKGVSGTIHAGPKCLKLSCSDGSTAAASSTEEEAEIYKGGRSFVDQNDDGFDDNNLEPIGKTESDEGGHAEGGAATAAVDAKAAKKLADSANRRLYMIEAAVVVFLIVHVVFNRSYKQVLAVVFFAPVVLVGSFVLYGQDLDGDGDDFDQEDLLAHIDSNTNGTVSWLELILSPLLMCVPIIGLLLVKVVQLGLRVQTLESDKSSLERDKNSLERDKETLERDKKKYVDALEEQRAENETNQKQQQEKHATDLALKQSSLAKLRSNDKEKEAEIKKLEEDIARIKNDNKARVKMLENNGQRLIRRIHECKFENNNLNVLVENLQDQWARGEAQYNQMVHNAQKLINEKDEQMKMLQELDADDLASRLEDLKIKTKQYDELQKVVFDSGSGFDDLSHEQLVAKVIEKKKEIAEATESKVEKEKIKRLQNEFDVMSALYRQKISELKKNQVEDAQRIGMLNKKVLVQAREREMKKRKNRKNAKKNN